ncbi:hypothetical protein BGP77_12045 [Saccharospirillum sp. MSK14-1]|nr:hypothetical protein BGP77_12045 [Saccharospirillum sp. MSK14-1]
MEQEFNRLFHEIPQLTGEERQQKMNRWFDVQISPYDTLETPRVGVDQQATDWLREHYRKEGIADQTEEEYLQKHHGVYVPRLTKPCDGIPVYSNSGLNMAAIHSFRGQFVVEDCSELVGVSNLDRLYQNTLAEDALLLAEDIQTLAKTYALKEGVAYVEHLKSVDAADTSAAQNAHILFSLAKWLRYWGFRGHGFEADY